VLAKYKEQDRLEEGWLKKHELQGGGILG